MCPVLLYVKKKKRLATNLSGVQRNRRARSPSRNRPPHHAGLEHGTVHPPQGGQRGRGQALAVPSVKNAALVLAGDVLESEPTIHEACESVSMCFCLCEKCVVCTRGDLAHGGMAVHDAGFWYLCTKKNLDCRRMIALQRTKMLYERTRFIYFFSPRSSGSTAGCIGVSRRQKARKRETSTNSVGKK